VRTPAWRKTPTKALPRLFLTALLLSVAVAFHRGPCEKRLRYVKLATSSTRDIMN